MAKIIRRTIGPNRLPPLESWVGVLAELVSVKGRGRSFFLTIAAIAVWIGSNKVIANGVGMELPMLHLAVVATLVELIRFIPVTAQGIGLREGAFAFLCASLGYGSEESYVVAVLVYLALSVSIVLAGPISGAIQLIESARNQKEVESTF